MFETNNAIRFRSPLIKTFPEFQAARAEYFDCKTSLLHPFEILELVGPIKSNFWLPFVGSRACRALRVFSLAIVRLKCGLLF